MWTTYVTELLFKSQNRSLTGQIYLMLPQHRQSRMLSLVNQGYQYFDAPPVFPCLHNDTLLEISVPKGGGVQ